MSSLADKSYGNKTLSARHKKSHGKKRAVYRCEIKSKGLSPEEHEADETVEQHVDEVVAERLQLMQRIIQPERQHAQRPVWFMALLLQSWNAKVLSHAVQHIIDGGLPCAWVCPRSHLGRCSWGECAAAGLGCPWWRWCRRRRSCSAGCCSSRRGRSPAPPATAGGGHDHPRPSWNANKKRLELRSSD